MDDPFVPENPVEMYLSREQIFRLAGFANDMLAGARIRSNTDHESYVYVSFIHVDNPHDVDYLITQDGTFEELAQ